MIRRIAFVITDSGVGGAEKALLALLRQLDRTRFDPCAVFVLKKHREMAKKWEAAGVPVRAFGAGRFPGPLTLRDLSSALTAARPDVVHALMFHSIQCARLVSGRSPWALVTSPRVSYRHFPAPARWADSLFRRRDELAVCESEAGRQELVSRGYPANAVRVAPNGVDVPSYARNPGDRARLRAEWGIADDEILIGGVGRLHRQKGFDVLIEAMATLGDRLQKCRVVIVGEGPENAALQAQTTRLNVPALFTGRRDDMPAVLSALDVYVQSSRFEGLSNALLEAMAAGLPCVATAVDGTLDFARDGENLLLARPEDPASLGTRLKTVLGKADVRAKLAENATITARQRSVELMVRAFEDAYDAAATHSF